MRVGDPVVFGEYRYQLNCVPEVFRRGDLAVVTAALADGELRIHGLSPTGEILWWRSDTVFVEEVIPLNNSLVVPAAGLARGPHGN